MPTPHPPDSAPLRLIHIDPHQAPAMRAGGRCVTQRATDFIHIGHKVIGRPDGFGAGVEALQAVVTSMKPRLARPNAG